MNVVIPLESKADFQALLGQMIDPLKPCYIEAGVKIGDTAACYGPETVALEGFLRPLWGLAPYWAGGGGRTGLETAYARGLAAGTNPDRPAYWGGFWNGDQRFVEMAALAYGLLVAPEVLWEPLSPSERDRLARWLYAINQYELPVCNWICFRVLVNVALRARGCAWDAQKLAAALEEWDSFYLGDGWYQDGDSGQKDYYVSFALHYYGLLYARFCGESDPPRAETFRSRAARFARDFVYWFDSDGTALPYGRSLTYRFAQAAFFSACALAGVDPFPPGVLKGLIVRHLQHWMQAPIFDRAGLLTIGYGYPNLLMAEKYNAPGSPYWALKIFAVLALPDNDPFWQIPAAPLPPLEPQRLLGLAGMLIRRYTNHTTAYTSGEMSANDLGHFPEKYSKFAYDTKFAFCVSRSNLSLAEAAPDSMLAFVVDGFVYVRRGCLRAEVTGTAVATVWSPCRGITVTTRIEPTPSGHRRRHEVEAEYPCIAYDCAFAVATNVPGDRSGTTADTAFSCCDAAGCSIRCTGGGGQPVLLGTDPNANLIHNMTRIPAIRFDLGPGRRCLSTEIQADCRPADSPAKGATP